MIVRSEDFQLRSPKWTEDSSVSDDLKSQLAEQGLAEPMNEMECMDIVDECFHCGRKLSTPYVYWQGALQSLSLHPKCAIEMALGFVQDGYEATKGHRAESERHAAAWLELYASKKEYGLEDEEFTGQ